MQGWTFTSGQTRTQTKTVTAQKTQLVGADISISVSAEMNFPEIVRVTSSFTAGAHWEPQSMQSSSNTDSVTIPMTVGQSNAPTSPLEPQTAIHCRVVAWTSN